MENSGQLSRWDRGAYLKFPGWDSCLDRGPSLPGLKGKQKGEQWVGARPGASEEQLSHPRNQG